MHTKVNVTETTTREVFLDEATINRITRERLRVMLGEGQYLRSKDGKLVVTQDDPHWRHGSLQEVYVRDATALDIAVFKVLEELPQGLL